MRLRFTTSCVNARRDDIHDMVDRAIEIGRRTFLQHVDQNELRMLSDSMAYAPHPRQGLTMAGDWHVSYHRSRYRGRRCYYFRHSAIEYIFADAGETP